ncbi:MAG: SulP family inorganic anion transporter [Candidatus Gracilibacteria bacterium]|nr:SulP family inorganic anion transporter [Candidatus Gracilibacteria bacterium]
MENLRTLAKANWKPGLAVALINIPLSISLAVASLGSGSTNAPLLGLITAIWAGSFAAIFASNNHNIYGPAGALSGILLAFVLQKDGGVIYIPFVAITAGIIILAVSFLRLTKYITLIPSAALHGFLMGVGVTIAASQLNSALGITANVQHEAIYQNILQTFSQITETNWLAFLLFALGLVFLLAMKKWVPKIPGAIPLTFIGILIGGVFTYLRAHGLWSPSLPLVQTIADKFPTLAFSLVDIPDFSSVRSDIFGHLETAKLILRYATVVAVIAILETIISAKIAEKLSKDPFHKDREVFGLGMANIASGIAGGMPATAVLVRTAFNIKSGATHRMSAFLTALFTLLIAWLCFDFFKLLPMPIIAAILMNIAIGMIDVNLYKNIHSLDKVSFYLTLFVGFVTVADDPIMGIVLGTAIALIVFLGKVSKGNVDVTVFRDRLFFDKLRLSEYVKVQHPNDIIIYRFAGTLNYLNIESQLEQVKLLIEPKTVIFSFGQVNSIDIDGIEAFEEIFAFLEKKGIEMYFTGISNPYVEEVLRKLPIYQEIETSGNIYRSSAYVLDKLGLSISKR